MLYPVVHTEWFENIFGEGWRDPSEDIQRLAIYIVASVGSALGVVAAGYGLYELRAQQTEIYITLAMLFGGLLLAYPSIKFLKGESRLWEFGYIDAEQVVTSGFMLGFAFLFIGALGAEIGAIAIVFMTVSVGLGLALLLLSLILGFICAHWHKLPWAKTVWHDVLIEERYAMDKMAQKIPNHPSPSEDGFTPCVRVRTSKGEYYELTCTHEAYRMAKPGSKGLARLIKYRVMAFERNT